MIRRLPKTPIVLTICALVLLAWPGGARAQDPENPLQFLEMIQSYLSLLDHMREISADPRSALLMAQNSMKEIYEKEGRHADAVPELRKILDGVDDPAVRTALRFTIADIYKETGQRERALEELRAIVAENKALLR